MQPGVFMTGMGAVSPLGVGTPAYIRALRDGVQGVRPLPFTSDRIKSTVAATVGPGTFDPSLAMSEADQRRVPRLVPMALHAARESLLQAGLADIADSPARARRVGLILGTGGGGIDFTLDQISAMNAGRQGSLWSITNATHGNLAGELSINLGLRGPSWCVSTGCASSSDAVGLALGHLRDDRTPDLDAFVVVGADAHVRWETLHGMEMLGVIATPHTTTSKADSITASRPFDLHRSGFVLGEGAWAVVLERPDFTHRRGVAPLAEVLGFSATCDAYHRVRPEPSMDETVRAMTQAISNAGLTQNQIEVLHYHGTGTKLNDALETRAVKLAFGDHAPRLRGHSVKGAIGHPQGASGLAALVATIGSLNQGFLPPTLNLTTKDPDCDLDYSPHHAGEVRPAAGARTALINTLAFGAKNSAIVARAAGQPRR